MKTLVTKTNTALALTAVFLLLTVVVSAQTFQDDVYYSPSKDTTKRVRPQVVKKEVKRTYRATSNKKVEDFSTAQKKYAEMLSKKQKRTNSSNSPQRKSWIYNTQGLTKKQDIHKEISLYNRGNVNANNPNEEDYHNGYPLWQTSTVTRVYTQPRWYSNFHLSFNFGWGRIYNPYYSYYYNPYWDYYGYYNNPYHYQHYYPHYYDSWGSPYYWGHGYYHPMAWSGRYYSPFYRHYYHHYYGHYYGNGGYYTPYYRNHYRDNYSYQQRPNEFSNDNTSIHRRNSAEPQGQQAIRREYREIGGERTNRRYSSNIYRRDVATNNSLNNNYQREHEGIENNTYNRYSTRREANSPIHQGKVPYTRELEEANQYRRSSITRPRHIENIRESQIYRRSETPQEYRDNTTRYRRLPETYQRRTTITPRRTENNDYYRSPSSSNNNYRMPSRSSTPSRSTYSAPRNENRSAPRSTPSRYDLDTRNRR